MPDIREIVGSRTGSSKGGKGTMLRVFRVLFSLDDDDITVLEDGTMIVPDPEEAVAAVHPPGEEHPWDETATARLYNVIDQKSKLHFVVQVIYRRLDFDTRGPTNDWKITVRGSTITNHILEAHELGAVVGFVPGGDPFRRNPLTAKPTPIGVPQFIPVPTAVPPAIQVLPTHFTTTFDRNGNITTIELIRTQAHDGSGRDEDLPALTVVFTRVVPNFSMFGMGRVADYMKSVNGVPFRGADPFHVKVDDIEINEVEMSIPGQRIPGKAWSISVVFLWSSIPMAPFERLHSFRNDDGFETRIVDKITGEPTSSAWDTVRRTNPEALLSFLAGR